MPGMSSDTSDHSSSSMAMTFYTSTSTPLFSSLWTPATPSAYAGSCIFLILLAAIFRALLAFKARQETQWLDRDLARRYVAVQGRPAKAEGIRDAEAGRRSSGGDEEALRDAEADVERRGSGDAEALRDPKTMVLTANGVEENVVVVARHGADARPWRLSVDPVRAGGDVVVAGVGYLL